MMLPTWTAPTMASKTPTSSDTKPPPPVVTDNSKSKKSTGVPVGPCCACKWPECQQWHLAFQRHFSAPLRDDNAYIATKEIHGIDLFYYVQDCIIMVESQFHTYSVREKLTKCSSTDFRTNKGQSRLGLPIRLQTNESGHKAYHVVPHEILNSGM